MLKQDELANSEVTMSLALKRAFLQLSLPERRKLLLEQAENVASHYEAEQSVREREAWQGDDIVDY